MHLEALVCPYLHVLICHWKHGQCVYSYMMMYM